MPTVTHNALINETSPYLLQHAHNPVEWYPWGNLSLDKAKKEDKPILISIGYAACHWCHVMERESFEDTTVAAYMNAHFINIKVDREERPDLDHIYMDALQALSGQGGWPLNVFLTPDGKPFYGGTYFPPQAAHNRPSWMDVLHYMADAWANKREDVFAQANKLLKLLQAGGDRISEQALRPLTATDVLFTKESCLLIRENLMRQADELHGGFGKAPKFPQTFSIRFLQNFAAHFQDTAAALHAEKSLSSLLHGGIYDQLAGGMARYSTDDQWLAPHFEKMLYDNALLISTLSEAYQIKASISLEQAIRKTLAFCEQYLRSEEGGYFAAIDADSEGEEGKYYVWDKQEVDALAGADSKLYSAWYGISEKGNWEGSNILHVSTDINSFAAIHERTPYEVESCIQQIDAKLLAARMNRTPPLTDHKIILGWNALYLIALCNASAALADEGLLARAESLIKFIEEKFAAEGLICFHTYTQSKAQHPAYLDDYAGLIRGYISLQELTGNQHYLAKARTMTEYVLEHFYDEEKQFFYFTHKGQENLIVRKLDLYDGATASGNSSMAENLRYLSTILDQPSWAAISKKMIVAMKPLFEAYPASFAVWARLYLYEWVGYQEWVVTGKGFEKLLGEVNQRYTHPRIIQAAATVHDFPLLQKKDYVEAPLLYYCSQGECYTPVKTIAELLSGIKKEDSYRHYSQ